MIDLVKLNVKFDGFVYWCLNDAIVTGNRSEERRVGKEC